jgi:hypothetical protein
MISSLRCEAVRSYRWLGLESKDCRLVAMLGTQEESIHTVEAIQSIGKTETCKAKSLK